MTINDRASSFSSGLLLPRLLDVSLVVLLMEDNLCVYPLCISVGLVSVCLYRRGTRCHWQESCRGAVQKHRARRVCGRLSTCKIRSVSQNSTLSCWSNDVRLRDLQIIRADNTVTISIDILIDCIV